MRLGGAAQIIGRTAPGERKDGVTPSGRLRYPRAGHGVNSFQCPSETTSTVPSTTLMAVSSSIAYAGPDKPAAHRSAAAIETGRPPKTHRLRPQPASRPRASFPNTGPAHASVAWLAAPE